MKANIAQRQVTKLVIERFSCQSYPLMLIDLFVFVFVGISVGILLRAILDTRKASSRQSAHDGRRLESQLS